MNLRRKKKNISIEKIDSKYSLQYIVSCRFCKKEFKMIEDCQSHKCDSSRYESSRLVHKCYLCSLTFSKKNHLDRHLKGHTRNKCTYCDAQFTKRKELCKHLKAKHNINEPEKHYICSFCKKSFAKKISLNMHMKAHSNGKPTCTQCGFMCENEETYAQHIKEHNKNSKYECELCCKKFARCQQYNQHMAGHEKHVCEPCQVNFPTKKLLRKHQQKIHGANILKRHPCKICGKRFARPIHLVVHQRTHSGEKPLRCLYCNKNYYSRETLAKHMKTVSHLKKVHKDSGEEVKVEKNFICEKCGSKFYRQQSLLRHVEMTHTAGDPFKCEHCEYFTKCKANLKRHSELHSKIKRYTCELCGQAFRALATLKDHHVFVHTEKRDFPCDMCDKDFKSNSDLQRHRKSHSDERPFKCSCVRSYKRLSHLRRHMETSKHYVETFSRCAQTEESPDEEANVDSPSKPVLHLEEMQGSSCGEPLALNETNDSRISNKIKSYCVENQNVNKVSSNLSAEEEHSFAPSNDVQMFFDGCSVPSENATLYPLNPAIEQPVLTLADLTTTENIAIPQLTAVMEQPVLTLTNENANESVTMPSLTMIEHPIITFTEQVPSENLAMSAVIEQPVVNYADSDTSCENIVVPSLSEIIGQNDATLVKTENQFESQTPNNNFFENRSLNLDTNSYCAFYPISSEQPSILNHQDSAQIILSVPSVQETPSCPCSSPNFTFQPSDPMPQTFISDVDQNDCSKQLFGDSGDILVALPTYMNNSFYAPNCPSQLLNSSASADMWDANCNKLTVCPDTDLGSNICSIFTPVQNLITTVPINVDNFVLSGDSLISSSIDSSAFKTELESFL